MTRPVTPIDQPKTQLGLRAKKPWTEVNPPEDTKNSCSTDNLQPREIRSADSVGRIEPHADKNEKRTKSVAVEIQARSCTAQANNQTVETG
jgi:hypothetical protein